MAIPVGDDVGNAVRLAIKQVVTVGLAVGDRLQAGVGEARAQIDLLVADARAEQQASRVASTAHETPGGMAPVSATDEQG